MSLIESTFPHCGPDCTQCEMFFDGRFEKVEDKPPAPTVQEPVAQAWDEGYRAGIDDERTSEASIGIAGFGAKVEPARNNPYRTTPPAAQQESAAFPEGYEAHELPADYTGKLWIEGQVRYLHERTVSPPAQRQWAGLTDKQMVDAIEPLYLNRSISEMAAEVSMADFRAIEAKLKELNNG